MIKKISDVTYRIKNLQIRKDRQVDHFNRPKPCPKDISLENQRPTTKAAPPTQPMPIPLASDIKLVEEDDAIFSTVHRTETHEDSQPILSTLQRNPSRARHPTSAMGRSCITE